MGFNNQRHGSGGKRGNRKRPFRHQQYDHNGGNGDEEDDECVDDLAHAAMFAIVPQPLAPTTTTTTTNVVDAGGGNKVSTSGEDCDENEIDIIDDEIDGSANNNADADDVDNDDHLAVEPDSQERKTKPGDGKHGEDENENGTSENSDDDESSSDSDADSESETDFMEAEQELQQIEGGDAYGDEEYDDDPVGNGRSSSSNGLLSGAPKTEHELDAYKMPIGELEKQLQIQLTVDHSNDSVDNGIKLANTKKIDTYASNENNSTATTTDRKTIIKRQFSLAGMVKNFMVADRTVVVQSSSLQVDGSSPTFPLDEGTALFVEKANDESAQMVEPKDQQKQYVPLGRIFEVFGPISQPLYTIRLQSPPTPKPSSTSSKQQKSASPAASSNKQDAPTQIDDTSEKKDQQHVQEKEQTTMVKTTTEQPVEATKVASSTVTTSSNSCPRTTTENETSEVVDGVSDNSASTENSNETKEKDSSIDQTDNHQNDSPEKVIQDTEKQNATKSQESETAMVSLVDPWGANGELTRLLLSTPNLTTYYISNEAKMIDTGHVMRVSGKGCDASNLYDEEVTNTNEMYFSDDEQEREAKNRSKNRNKNKNSNRDTQSHDDDSSSNRNIPETKSTKHRSGRRQPNNRVVRGRGNTRGGQHAQTTFHQYPPPPSAQQYQQQPYYPWMGPGQPAPLPQGFHHQMPPPPPPPPAGGPMYPNTNMNFPNPQYPFHYQNGGGYGAPMMAPYPPPPPPPPAGGQMQSAQHSSNSYPGSQTHHQQQQPPSASAPTTRNPNEPPAYQY